MKDFTPSDWIELAKVVSNFVSAICVPVATIYVMIIASRTQTLKTDVALLEKNTNSISERNQAIAMKLGITEGIAQERASVLANSESPSAPASPIPVTDGRTAAAVERVADAITSAVPNDGRAKD